MKKRTDLTHFKLGRQQDKLSTLPVVPEISSYLTRTDKNALFTSNQTFYREHLPDMILSALLQCVVTGNQDKVIHILGLMPRLMVRQDPVTDKSRRTFKASAAELVRWCGDWYMANAMLNVLKSLPNKNLAEQIRSEWMQQDDAYDKNGGLEFVLPDGTKPPKLLQFSLDPLLNELQGYINNFDTMSIKQKEEQWCKQVGQEQFLLPAYYLQQYCNPAVPFNPTPFI